MAFTRQLTGPVAALVFDLDDTLYPETQYVRSGFRAVADHLAHSPCPDRLAPDESRREELFTRLWQAFETGPRHRVFNTVLRQLDRTDDPQLIAHLVALYRSHRPFLYLAPAVADMLRRLRGRYQLGLLTDGYLPAQKLKVEALGLADAFDCIIYTEQLGRQFWKPAPRAFELMAQQLGRPHQHCVYIADNPAKDFIAPNQLGWQTVQVRSGAIVHTSPAPPPGGRPRIVLGPVTDLETILP